MQSEIYTKNVADYPSYTVFQKTVFGIQRKYCLGFHLRIPVLQLFNGEVLKGSDP